MRLQRHVPVAGLEPELARTIARLTAVHQYSFLGIAQSADAPEDELRRGVDQLVKEEFLEPSRRVERPTTG